MDAERKRALAGFVDQYLAGLQRTAFLLTGEWVEADRLTEDALAALVRQRLDLSDAASGLSRARGLLVHLAGELDRRDTGGDLVDGRTEARDPEERLLAALAGLGRTDRAALILVCHEGLDAAEAGRVIGLPGPAPVDAAVERLRGLVAQAGDELTVGAERDTSVFRRPVGGHAGEGTAQARPAGDTAETAPSTGVAASLDAAGLISAAGQTRRTIDLARTLRALAQPDRRAAREESASEVTTAVLARLGREQRQRWIRAAAILAVLVLVGGAWLVVRPGRGPAPAASIGAYAPVQLSADEVRQRCQLSADEVYEGSGAMQGGWVVIANVRTGQRRNCLVGYARAPVVPSRPQPVPTDDDGMVAQCGQVGGYDFTGWTLAAAARRTIDTARRTVSVDDSTVAAALVSTNGWLADCRLGGTDPSVTFQRLQGGTANTVQLQISVVAAAGALSLAQGLTCADVGVIWGPDGLPRQDVAHVTVSSAGFTPVTVPVDRGVFALAVDQWPAKPQRVSPELSVTFTMTDADGRVVMVTRLSV